MPDITWDPIYSKAVELEGLQAALAATGYAVELDNDRRYSWPDAPDAAVRILLDEGTREIAVLCVAAVAAWARGQLRRRKRTQIRVTIFGPNEEVLREVTVKADGSVTDEEAY